MLPTDELIVPPILTFEAVMFPACDTSKCNSSSGYPCGTGGLKDDCLAENLHLKSCQLNDYSHLNFQIPSVDIQFCQTLPLQKSNGKYTTCQ